MNYVNINPLPPQERYTLMDDQAGWGPATPKALVIGTDADNPKRVFAVPLLSYDMKDTPSQQGKQRFRQSQSFRPEELDSLFRLNIQG